MEPLAIGDVIETTEPNQTDSLNRAVHKVRVQLLTQDSVDYARCLVAWGVWRKVENQKGD